MTGLGDTRTEAEIEELCQLLLGMDRGRLLAALDRLDDRDAFTELQSRTLVDAMRRALARDRTFADSMGAIISKGVHATVQRDSAAFGLALAPAMGPAIRNSVRLMLQSFMNSIEAVVDQRLSVRSLRWRFEAWRSGCSFAEVVFRNTLLFRVEHVFLVHREGGVQLVHASPSGVITREPELIAAMLTAIQDFVGDAFHVARGDTLTSFAVGDLTVVVESGSHAALAAVVRGKAPSQLRLQLRESLDSIESSMGQQLASFDGSIDEFEAVVPYVETCLVESELPNAGSAKKKKRWWPWVLFGAAVLGLVWLVLGWVEAADTRGRFRDFLAELRQEPGIVVTEVEPTADGWVVRGMRDPLSREVESIAAEHRVETRVMPAMQLHHSLHPAFVLERAKRLLAPPAAVTIALQDGDLVLAGEANHDWCVRASLLAGSVAGVTGVDTAALVDGDEAAWQAVAARLRDAAKSLASLERGYGEDHRWLVEQATELDLRGRRIDRLTSLRCTLRLPPDVDVPAAEARVHAFLAALSGVVAQRFEFVGSAVDVVVTEPMLRFEPASGF